MIVKTSMQQAPCLLVYEHYFLYLIPFPLMSGKDSPIAREPGSGPFKFMAPASWLYRTAKGSSCCGGFLTSVSSSQSCPGVGAVEFQI